MRKYELKFWIIQRIKKVKIWFIMWNFRIHKIHNKCIKLHFKFQHAVKKFVNHPPSSLPLNPLPSNFPLQINHPQTLISSPPQQQPLPPTNPPPPPTSSFHLSSAEVLSAELHPSTVLQQILNFVVAMTATILMTTKFLKIISIVTSFARLIVFSRPDLYQLVCTAMKQGLGGLRILSRLIRKVGVVWLVLFGWYCLVKGWNIVNANNLLKSIGEFKLEIFLKTVFLIDG